MPLSGDRQSGGPRERYGNFKDCGEVNDFGADVVIIFEKEGPEQEYCVGRGFEEK